jgi:hypothetical protein
VSIWQTNCVNHRYSERVAQRRRGAESTKKIKQLFISKLCASASRREIVHFSHFPVAIFLCEDEVSTTC